MTMEGETLGGGGITERQIIRLHSWIRGCSVWQGETDEVSINKRENVSEKEICK